MRALAGPIGAADALIHWQLIRETREPWSNFTCSSASLLTDGCSQWDGHAHSFRLRSLTRNFVGLGGNQLFHGN